MREEQRGGALTGGSGLPIICCSKA